MRKVSQWVINWWGGRFTSFSLARDEERDRLTYVGLSYLNFMRLLRLEGNFLSFWRFSLFLKESTQQHLCRTFLTHLTLLTLFLYPLAVVSVSHTLFLSKLLSLPSSCCHPLSIHYHHYYHIQVKCEVCVERLGKEWREFLVCPSENSVE